MESAVPASPLRHWRTTTDIDGLLWLTLDCEGATLNTLGSAVLAELEQLVAMIERNPPRGVALLSGKHGSFIAGADVREFDQVTDAAMARAQIEQVHALFNRIERLPCPTVASIDGICLGGGLELAVIAGIWNRSCIASAKEGSQSTTNTETKAHKDTVQLRKSSC